MYEENKNEDKDENKENVPDILKEEKQNYLNSAEYLNFIKQIGYFSTDLTVNSWTKDKSVLSLTSNLSPILGIKLYERGLIAENE